MENAVKTTLAVVCCMAALFAVAQEEGAAAGRPTIFNRPGLGGRAPGRLFPRARPNAAGQPNAAEAQTESSTSGAGAGKSVEPGGRSIEFNGAPVEMVLKVYGELVDKTVLKDPAAPAATITLQPKQGQQLSDEDKILAIETVLEMNGIHLVKR